MAFFVFFAGAAGAGVVTADLGARANWFWRFGLRRAGLILHFFFLALLLTLHFAGERGKGRRGFFGYARRGTGGGCKGTRCRRRSLALRLRGLAAISSREGDIAPRVTSLSVALCPHVHTGCLGGQMQSRDSLAKNCFTIRSSSEW